MKFRDIFFNELNPIKQAQILDMYGAKNAAELGYDKHPYARVVYDFMGDVEGIELLEPAI